MGATTSVLAALKSAGAFGVAKRVTRSKLRIVCYHGLWMGGEPQYGDCLYMQPRLFEQRMEWLAGSGYPVLPLDDAIQRLDNGSLPDNAVAITIDDGWWSTLKGMVPVLERLKLPAALYATTYYSSRMGPVLNVLIDYMVFRAEEDILVRSSYARQLAQTNPGLAPQSRAGRNAISGELASSVDALPGVDRLGAVQGIANVLGIELYPILNGRWFDLMTEDELREARGRGIDVQLHTHTHRMHGLLPDKVVGEIEMNRRELSRILGVQASELRHFCYPSGVHSQAVFEAVRSAGILSATTTESGLVGRTDERMSLSRILDCQSMTMIEFEARLTGIWDMIAGVRRRLRGGDRGISD